ncbi:uncharacterized protein LOC127720338 [Mytilus californianus]|uniref:uncharacterized protein LOC127720338 n=1 Tax=Mytilus californianus TaxID=6549 RepID=UPI0022473427|nr:uncharacterized protein LOC127720338 [Mytilus californianus]
MASPVPICDICMTDNITKSATVWCSECEEAICNDCERQHDRMGLSKNHKTTSIKDYQELPSSVAAIKQICKGHNLKFDFYCAIHNEPCCVSCVTEKHGTCLKLEPLSEVVKGVKSSAAFADLEERTKDISALIGDLITEKKSNRASFGVQKNKIISEVQYVRLAINNHLDKLQKDLLNKLGDTEKLQNKTIDSFIEKLSDMRKNVENISGDMKKSKQHASNFQAFLGIHEWNKKIEAEEKYWMSLQTDQIMDTFDIHIQYSPILIKFETDVKELGKLEVKSSSTKKILLKKEKQGQIFVPVSNTVDNIKLTTLCCFQTPVVAPSTIIITGIDMFDDERIVLADNHLLHNRLVIINQEGKFIKTIQLKYQCFDVAVIDTDTVATTLIDQKKIYIIDVNSSKVQRYIPTGDKCNGITYSGEQLVVNLINNTIQFFDLSGNTLSTLSTADASVSCSVLNDKLYYTAHKSDTIYSTELNGEVRWKFNCHKSDHPAGIVNDAAGNIFVACRNSHQVVVLGQDGKKSRILLTKKDGLKQPRAIHYNHKTNILIVCNVSGQCFQYKVTN